MESDNRPTPEALRRVAVDRVGYLLWLADKLATRDVHICSAAAHELRTIAEGGRVNHDSQEAGEGR